jgi:glucose-1-phosphate cytidylyltransferase
MPLAMPPADITTVILCGGQGTRAYPGTSDVPKPLIDVDGQPMLRHVMDIYAVQGCRRFVLAAGFKAHLIAEFAGTLPRGWEVTVSDAGTGANTGQRVLECRGLVTDPFFVTYGDGLGDVDLGALFARHESHGGCATLTTVPLRSQYGTVDTDPSGQVVRFAEKPVLRDHWINGGFFVFDRTAFDEWEGEDLERDVLPALAGRRLLFSYRHEGFWRSLDTHKDALELRALAEGNRRPWMPSAHSAAPGTQPQPS